jgi:drug/metabolite transporter (DMT)-like permease
VKRPTGRHYGALAISIVLNSATLVLLKAVALTHMGEAQLVSLLPRLVAVALDPLFLSAVAAFLAGIYFWIVALRRIALSLAYPSVSVSYILIAVLSWKLFSERIGSLAWAGILLTVIGVTLMFLTEGKTGRASQH